MYCIWYVHYVIVVTHPCGLQIRYKPNGCVLNDLWYGACTGQRRPFVTRKEQERKANIGYSTTESCEQGTMILLTNYVLMVS